MSRTGTKLRREFYEREDVVEIAQDLLGKVICTNIEGRKTAGMITETEAYRGRDDKACHANDGLRTPRTEVMYGPPGHAYVYLCYGIHHLFNVVTNREGLADAVLIRAIQPLDGLKWMAERRDRAASLDPGLSNGPGKLTQALGITTDENSTDLLGEKIWIEKRQKRCGDQQISATPRIGIDYAGKDADNLWRFHIKNTPWVSR